LISAPGQTERKDVYSLTSNADLLPTILSIAGQNVPEKLEGRVLPELGGTEDMDRSVFTVFAKENSSFLPLTHAILSMNNGQYKLIYYRNYPGDYRDKVELYDLTDDPEELQDLAKDNSATVNRMKEELLELAQAADLPYQSR
jgi:choline-sulfatase